MSEESPKAACLQCELVSLVAYLGIGTYIAQKSSSSLASAMFRSTLIIFI